MSTHWRIWIDTGGTFTDIVAVDPDNIAHRHKILSTGALRGEVVEVSAPRIRVALPGLEKLGRLVGLRLRRLGSETTIGRVVAHDRATGWLELDPSPASSLVAGKRIELVGDEPAPLLAARLATGTPLDAPLPPCVMRLAMTRGTNALLERRGAPTAFFVTAGFGDLLVIGDQTRPDIFALAIERPAPLTDIVVEVPGRIDASGAIVDALDLDGVDAAAARLRESGIESAAIALINSDRNQAHEEAVAERLRAAGFRTVVASAQIARRLGLLARAETAVLEAYLGPTVRGYVDEVAAGLASRRLHLLTSAGGLVDASAFCARDSLLSGPAGGVAGAAAVGRRCGETHIIGLDMGGTSTDVSRYTGDFEYVFEHRVGGVRNLAPALAIETVAAGGGSICAFRDGRLLTGPASAGAFPGPACYGAGGPLTMTDVNVLLGHLDSASFAIPIDVDAARVALGELAVSAEINGEGADRDELLDALRAINDERIADAIAEVSVRQGYDAAEHALVAFGGAGGQHACAVAERLGMTRVIVPVDASVLSAVGLGAAVAERFAERQVLAPLADVEASIPALLEELSAQAHSALRAEGVTDAAVRRRLAFLRLAGQETSLEVSVDAPSGLAEAFRARHVAIYGHPPPARPIELESLRVVVSATPEPVEPTHAASVRAGDGPEIVRARFAGTWRDVPRYHVDDLADGQAVSGPALVALTATTAVIPPGWSAGRDCSGALVARRAAGGAAMSSPKAARSELFANRLTSIARSMGHLLARTAISPNVRQRLDFSCAVLSGAGELVVNAPHIPVHLGAIGACVRRIRETVVMRPGDVIITNHPGWGGSHLPDVTVITPVFAGPSDETPLAFVANRAHHAEIGGRRPGSMPPGSTCLAEEGAVIVPRHLVDGGVERYDEIAALLTAPPWPTRALDDNLADLRGQVAANRHGAVAILQLVESLGASTIEREMEAIAEHAAGLAESALRAFPDGVYAATEALDDGTPLAVTMTIEGGHAHVDFTGTGPVHPGNLNATPAIVESVVIYVLRVLVGERLPLNDGLMRHVRVTIPSGLLDPPFGNDPECDAAVAGGNVETSQRLVDTLLKALGLCAGSQGTMNNVVFGCDTFGYYETVGGGSGAGPGFAGVDGIHTHMTNTRITDPEVVERRLPVRIERFGLRRGSGGAGTYRGGDGLVRVYRFGAVLELGVLTQHRGAGPFGMAGGKAGAPGRQHLIRTDGSEVLLAACDECTVDAGDLLVLETPGGGGWGPG